MTGETLILLVLPVGEKPGVNRIGRTVRLDDGDAHDHGMAKPAADASTAAPATTSDHLPSNQSAVYLRIDVTRPAIRRRC